MLLNVFMDHEQKNGKKSRELAAKNIKLAIFLGLVAFGFYIGFILLHL
jgi:uncharacterized membrane protein (DUF485 family)